MNTVYRVLSILLLTAAFAASVGCKKEPAFSAADKPTDKGMVIPKGMPGVTPPKSNSIR